MSAEDSTESKIIVDEDWKAKVQAEKEAEQAKQAQSGSPAPQASAADSPAAKAPEPPADAEERTRGPMPPPTLSTLLSTLATQAFISMGAAPNPFTGKPEVDLEQAKHFIDLVAMLEQKTQGNRSPQEIALLSSALHELRLAFLEAGRRK